MVVMSLRRFLILAGLFMFLLVPLAGGELAAQGISARAYLNPESVGVGQTFTLNLQVDGSQSVDSEPELPDLSAIARFLGSGSSTSMRVINQRSTVSLTVQYRFQALTEGTYEIAAFTVTVGGDEYSTEPINLVISESAPTGSQPEGGQDDPTVIGSDDLFLSAEVSRRTVREGEPFVVEYRIFTRVNITSYGFTQMPEFEGFWVEELPLPDQAQVEEVERNGQRYTTAVIRRVALVPTGPGERTLGPMGMEAQVRVQRQRTFDPFESFFELDRSSLFDSQVPVSTLSDPISIQVEPLPPGRTEPFSGVVGNLSVSASLSPDSVDANEAVTLTISASGRGNLKAIPEPELDLPPDFEAYPPEISESVQRSGAGLSGRKSWEFVLIPRAPGNRTLPAIPFGYFDTEAGAYRTASTSPLELTVSGELAEGPGALVRGGVASLREDIRFIHMEPARLNRTHGSLFGGTAFWLILLLPMASVLGVMGLRVHLDRLERDPAYARGRRAGKVAHARLGEARRLAKDGAPREFYAEAALALRGFLADKLNVAEAGMQMTDVTEGLAQKGVSREVADEVLACLDHCDLNRFAPERDDAEAESRFLERVSKVMTELNRGMGR